MDCNLSGFSVCVILQARILEWVAISSSRGSSLLKDRICIYCISRQVLYHWCHPPQEDQTINSMKEDYQSTRQIQKRKSTSIQESLKEEVGLREKIGVFQQTENPELSRWRESTEGIRFQFSIPPCNSLMLAEGPTIQLNVDIINPEIALGPQVQGSIPRDRCHCRCQQQVQAVTCATDQPAISQEFF